MSVIRSFSTPPLRQLARDVPPPSAGADRPPALLHPGRQWKHLKPPPGRAAQSLRPLRNTSQPRGALSPRRHPQRLKPPPGRPAPNPQLLRNLSQPRRPTSRPRPCLLPRPQPDSPSRGNKEQAQRPAIAPPAQPLNPRPLRSKHLLRDRALMCTTLKAIIRLPKSDPCRIRIRADRVPRRPPQTARSRIPSGIRPGARVSITACAT